MDEKIKLSTDVKPEKVQKADTDSVGAHSEDEDEALRVLKQHGGPLEPLTEEAAKALLRKIDWRIMPLLMATYLIQFWDKVTISQAAILGIKTDTHLTGDNFNWLGSIFYFGYLLFEYPHSMAIQRFPVAKYLSVTMFLWGIILMCHAACTNWVGLMVTRFFLGAMEGSITAGFLVLTVMFYRHDEIPRRVGTWFLMNGSAQICAGFVSWCLLQVEHPPIGLWRIYFLMCGGITILLSIAYAIYLPDSPTTAKFLTHQEKIWALERIKDNQTGVENKHWKSEQAWEAISDPKLWLFAFFSLLDNIPNSLTSFQSTVINDFGFDVKATALLGMVPGLIEILVILSGNYLTKYYTNSRAIISMSYFLPTIIGCALTASLPFSNKGGLLASYYIANLSTPAFVIALAWLSSTTAGHTKRVTSNAVMLIAYCVGNLIGPHVFVNGPRFTVAWIVFIVCYALCACIMVALLMLLKYRNKQKDKKMVELDVSPRVLDDKGQIKPSEELAWLDLTDFENPLFRYVL